MNSTYKAIIHRVDSFPPLPGTVSQVLMVTSSSESSARDLMEAILPDQAMCTAILKVANSALFGRPKQISSLETAVMVLGFNEVQSIILGKAVFNSFHDLSNKYRNELDAFWNHSFTCGLSAKILAKSMDFSQGEFFIGGLIHDIGKLAMFMALPETYSPMEWFFNGLEINSRVDMEKSAFEISHDEVGEKLLKRWLFPPQLLAAVGGHHDPLITAQYPNHKLLIQLADIFSVLYHQLDIQDKADVARTIYNHFPDIESSWLQYNLQINESLINSWYAQLIDELQDGSTAIQSMLAS